MRKPTFGPILLAFALFGILLFIPERYLLSLISDKKVEQAATSLSPNMFQGVALQKKMLEDKKYLPIYGSSELSRLDVYHPSNYFKANPDGFTPFLIGRGGTQSLVQFLNFAATTGELKNKQIVFIISPQWFVREGLSEMHFAPNFSSLQAYEFVFNKDIHPSMKKQAARRLLHFNVVRKDKMLTTMLEGITHDDAIHKGKAAAVTPFAYTYKNILERRDIFLSLTAIKPRRENVDMQLRNLPLNQLYRHAEQTGEKESKSNPFGIVDQYYYKKIAKKLAHLKGYRANERYDKSPEYKDLQMILDLLKQTNTKALFISIPVNGPWYDYAGFPKERREVYYKKVRNEIEKEGFQVADFSDHEYDKYFLKDTLHVGWKGWVYIDQSIKEFHEAN
jgi:D-alanine transfer protein